MRRLIQTQEDAIKSIRGQTGELIEHPTLPIKAVLNINTPKSVTLALWQGAGGRPLHYYLYRSEEQARTDLALFWARAEQLLMSRARRLVLPPRLQIRRLEERDGRGFALLPCRAA
jgi:hypothetical protein